MKIDKTKALARIFAVALALAIVEYVLLYNFPLASISRALENKDLSVLGPKDRVKKEEVLGEEVEKQVEDIIYFSTKSSGYDSATVKVTYQNGNPEQEIHIGFKDQVGWHYKTKPLDLPLINNLNWPSVKGEGWTLFQKTEKYSSLSDFFADPPTDSVVGFYYANKIDMHESVVVGHIPADKKITKIDVPLRGSHTFYVYLKNEPFVFRFTKQDLNWYDGEDKLTVKVYKQDKLMTEKTLLDDGITDSSSTTKPPEELVVQYDGEGFPESGIYKVVLEAGGDVIINSIETPLKQIVFEGPIYPINNSDVYSEKLVKTVPLNLITNATEISFKTNHIGGLQDIKVGDSILKLSEVQMEYMFAPETKESEIELSYGDVVINGLGFFAFSKDQFFVPKPYIEYTIKETEDIKKVDYILTNYNLPSELNNWKTATLEFNLTNASYQNGTLSWIIKAPKLKERGGEILIKNIDVTMHKESVLN